MSPSTWSTHVRPRASSRAAVVVPPCNVPRIHQQRTRPDQAHFAADDVDQAGEFIQPGSAQPGPKSGQSVPLASGRPA